MAKKSSAPKKTAKSRAAKKNQESPLEFALRHTMHDILDHLLKHWDAFSKAAKQTKITPAQALASLLAKAVIEVLAEDADQPSSKK